MRRPTTRPRTRKAQLEAARARRRYPVVIIGAGINGCGLFRELAVLGIDCLLIDKGDICSGTSAAPSRLIHGGLKYLETGEFQLVAESTLERNLLLANAPHVVQPLQALVPVSAWLSGLVPAARRFLGSEAKFEDRGALVTRLGLWLYGWHGRRHRSMPGSGFIGRTAAHRQLPHLRADIIGLASYYDAWISQPERLGVELVLDALETNPGSACIPYGALEGREDGALVLRDPIEGAAVQIEGEIVVNAAGPWIDRVNRALGPVTRYIGGAKGSHLMLDHPELVRELAGRMIYFGTPDGRICLVFPFLGLALLGSTDIRVDDPDAARCDAAETAYMLGQLKTLFPGFEIDERHIVYRYCGVRPLPASDALDPGAVSRDHMVRVDEPDADRAFPVLSLIGGKWTTFRALAEEVADMLLARIGRDRTSHTRDLAIGGGRDFPRDDAARHKWIAGQAETSGLDQTRVGALLERYGTTAARVAAHCAGAQDAPLSSLPSYSRAELQELAEHELVGRLADVLFRRTTLAITGQLSRALVEEAAAAIAPTMGWDEPRQQAEIAATLETAAERHDVRL